MDPAIELEPDWPELEPDPLEPERERIYQQLLGVIDGIYETEDAAELQRITAIIGQCLA